MLRKKLEHYIKNSELSEVDRELFFKFTTNKEQYRFLKINFTRSDSLSRYNIFTG